MESADLEQIRAYMVFDRRRETRSVRPLPVRVLSRNCQGLHAGEGLALRCGRSVSASATVQRPGGSLNSERGSGLE